MTTQPVETRRPEEDTGAAFGWKTVLFNCDCHSFEQVIRQLVKAINCGRQRAEVLAWEAHRSGSAVVYQGHRERCEAVAAVLEEIALQVRVTQ